MYFYVEIGNNEEVRSTMNLARQPRPDEIKIMPNGLRALRPLVTDELPNPDIANLYEVSDPKLVVEAERVVRKFTMKLRPNWKQVLKDRVIGIAHAARTSVVSSNELSGTGLQVKMMMDEEAEEFDLSPAEERTPERFPLVYCAVGTLEETAEKVSARYRKDFQEIRTQFALVEGEKFRLLARIDAAETPDAAVRAFDSRIELFKNR